MTKTSVSRVSDQHPELPAVSVVMASHLNSANLERSIASVLSQARISLELIIVGDGDPDGLAERLSGYCDPRIRYFAVSRQGLTCALQFGCHQASYPLIARLDAGDVMMATRLAQQARVLHENPVVGLVSSNMAFFTPEGYFLFDTDDSQAGLQDAIRHGDATLFASPAHASTMFRKADYNLVGGYRAEFYYAQDCDLWTRLLEGQQLVHLSEALTMGEYAADGISGSYSALQREFLGHAVNARFAREASGSDQQCLNLASEQSSKLRADLQKCKTVSAQSSAGVEVRWLEGMYFLARCLMRVNWQHAELYFVQILHASLPKINLTVLKTMFYTVKNRLHKVKHPTARPSQPWQANSE